jgi:hypothetical protein
MYYTIGKVATHFGVQTWWIRRCIERKLLHEPKRVGAYRVWVESDLPAIEAALRKAGYLKDQEATCA